MRTIIFDFETNGLLNKPDCQPVEFSCLVIKGETIKEQDVLIKCLGTMDEKAEQTHGLSKEVLEEKGIDFNLFLEGLDKILFNKEVSKIVGHNIINFDIPLAERLLNKTINKDLIFDTAAYFKGELLNKRFFSSYQHQKDILDTWARDIYFNLGAAIKHYNINTIEGNLHRAMTDVKYSYEVYKEQIKKL